MRTRDQPSASTRQSPPAPSSGFSREFTAMLTKAYAPPSPHKFGFSPIGRHPCIAAVMVNTFELGSASSRLVMASRSPLPLISAYLSARPAFGKSVHVGTGSRFRTWLLIRRSMPFRRSDEGLEILTPDAPHLRCQFKPTQASLDEPGTDRGRARRGAAVPLLPRVANRVSSWWCCGSLMRPSSLQAPPRHHDYAHRSG